MLTAVPLPGLPEVAAGDDLGALIAAALPGVPGGRLAHGDILAVAQKVVSKAEGRVRRLAEVHAGAQARELAARLSLSVPPRDPRHVQVILDESRSVLRAERGVLICETHHGLVCANAGVDSSNTAADGELILLPADPDASARALRARLRELADCAPGVIVTDSFGRAWRHGQAEVAIGLAGVAPLADWRGRADARGRALRATWIAVADELAAAADLVRAKDSLEPVVLLRGAMAHVTDDDGPGAAALIRPEAQDLFR